MQLGVLAVVITIVYVLPVAFICFRTYSDAHTSETAAHKGAFTRFFDLLVYTVVKSEQGAGGFVLAVVIHVQLYGLLFVMMWCALHIRDIADKMKKLKDKNAGTYKGLELHDVEDAVEKRQANLGEALAEDSQLIQIANNDISAPVEALVEDMIDYK